MHRTNQIKYVI